VTGAHAAMPANNARVERRTIGDNAALIIGAVLSRQRPNSDPKNYTRGMDSAGRERMSGAPVAVADGGRHIPARSLQIVTFRRLL
jgi:hypothetical protein